MRGQCSPHGSRCPLPAIKDSHTTGWSGCKNSLEEALGETGPQYVKSPSWPVGRKPRKMGTLKYHTLIKENIGLSSQVLPQDSIAMEFLWGLEKV